MVWSKPIDTKIKICGIRKVSDALLCEQLGVDAIGLVFYNKSPRFVEIDTAKEIVNSLSPFITTVGLFVNPNSNYVKNILNVVNLDCLQFHGDETDQFCNQFHRKWFKAIRMNKNIHLLKEIEKYPNSSAILLDAFDKNYFGGTGKTFDWSDLPKKFNKPLILAGGLHSGNILDAISQISPYAVDVSSGVESEKGKKSAESIKKFVAKLR